MLQVHNLTVSYGAVRVLNAVSFGLSAGEALAVVGANGCGKTTLIRCLVGEIGDYGGEVVLNRHVRIAYLPQEGEAGFQGAALERALSFDREMLRVYRGIQEGRYELCRDYSEMGGYGREDLIRAYGGNFGVGDVLEEPYATLSLGQQRKVDLAGMLTAGAEVLIFDEPANFLDIRGITAFEEGARVAKSRGQAALIVSHDRRLISGVSEAVYTLSEGHLERL